MKALLAATLVSVCLSAGSLWACGGMATVDPPTLQIDDGPPTPPVHSVVSDLSSCLVIC